MHFTATELPGVFLIDVERLEDERGFFARTWCAREMARHGVELTMVQGNASVNPRPGTLRGLHYQAAPHEETKLVRCTRGAIFDVVVDVRPASPTCGQWLGVELRAGSYRQLLVPAGCAHGFLTLAPNTEVTYLMSACYEPGAARGLRWNDPAIGIRWPHWPELISAKDLNYPDWQPPAATPRLPPEPERLRNSLR
ncbi:dTDP-4-dehydrorhamnose 3,5-epimerase [Hymenobacter convexus]|uniref:dTDP-4-dehydrorhamnose 3,5-epimerase n=1 Tax=Hymenobacter sp. CA1UV-4 TaxID=3063782 RepID=UPI002712B794|nr:dTDP-4-dehydrorhamnose 3,5-epimerase [Hymenobacter sp. CA1UV-4]MDO7852491.1 dTDP-4-dehydrorhamnose 3,5-epimerase [Hymenobacter sp. CA1UV-4]